MCFARLSVPDHASIQTDCVDRHSDTDLLYGHTNRTMATQQSASQPIASTSSSTGTASLSQSSNTASASGNGNASSSTAGPGVQPGRSGMGNPPDMHLDTTTGKWMFEDPQTGQEFEWNEAANAWLPVVEDDLIKQQQAAYSVQGVDETVSSYLPGCMPSRPHTTYSLASCL